MGSAKKQTIGYRYFMGLHMAICQGPVDSIDQIYVGKRSLEITPETSNATVFVAEQDLFGGDKKEGGIVGNVDVEFGADTQVPNAYLTEQFGATTPAFRGTTCVVFREHTSIAAEFRNYASGGGGGYIAAMSPYPKAWAFAVTDIPGGVFNPTKQIINGSANGGHIIYDCLTDSDWGLGILSTDLDTASFTNTTDTLFAEGMGLSLIYAQQSTMQSFLQVILDHINAVLYTDRKTGKFVLKLIRDDFDVGSLPVFDETNIASLTSFQRPAFADLVNEVVLSYRKKGDFEDSTITVQDLASVQAQSAVISQTVAFDGIDTDALAAIIAAREIKQASTPLARVQLVVNREAWDTNPGDVIKLSWAAYGVELLVLRVVDVDYGDFKDGLVRLDTVEDIFGLPSNSYIAPVSSGWTDEVVDPVAAGSTLALEMPYFVVQTQIAADILSELVPGVSLLQSVAENPATPSFNYKLNTRIGAADYVEVTDSGFAPTVFLTATLNATDTTDIPFKTLKGGVGDVVIGGYAYLNGEALRIDAVDPVLETMTVGRGYLDTSPKSHAVDDVIYFADENSALDPTLYSDSDVVNAKVLTQTGRGVLDLADAVEDTVTMAGRRERPYPAAQVRLNTEYFPTALDAVIINVTWTYQDRLQQLAQDGEDWYTIDLGAPEEGVLYNVRYYNDDTTALLFADVGIVGKASTYSVVGAIGLSFNMRVEVEAVRDGTVLNFETFEHIFAYTKPLEVRALENADTRTLENGDTRILEN